MKGVSTPSNLLDSTYSSEFIPSQMRKNRIFKQIQSEEITGWNSGNSPTQFGGDNDQFYNNNDQNDIFEQIKTEMRQNTRESGNFQALNQQNIRNSKLNILMDIQYPSSSDNNMKYPGQTNALKELSNNLQIHTQQKKNVRYGGINYDQAINQFTQQPFQQITQKGKRKSLQFASLSNNQSHQQPHNVNNQIHIPNISSPQEDFSSIVNELKQLKEFLTSPLPTDSNNQQIQRQFMDANTFIDGANKIRNNSIDSQERELEDPQNSSSNNNNKNFQIRKKRINSFQLSTAQRQQTVSNQLNFSDENLKLRNSNNLKYGKEYTTNNTAIDDQTYASGQQAITQSNHFHTSNGNMINLSTLTAQVAHSAIVSNNTYTQQNKILNSNLKNVITHKTNNNNTLEFRRKRGNTIDLLPKISEMTRYQNTIKTSRLGSLKTSEHSQKSNIGMNKIRIEDNNEQQQQTEEQQSKTNETRSSYATIQQIKKLMNKERIYYKENMQQLESLRFPQSKTQSSHNTARQDTFFLKTMLENNNNNSQNQSNCTAGDQTSRQAIKIQNQNQSILQQFDDSQFTQDSGCIPVNQFNSKFQISLAEYLKQNATQRQQFFNNQKKQILQGDCSKRDQNDFNRNVKIKQEKYSLNNILQHSESPRQRSHIPIPSSSNNINQSRLGSLNMSQLNSLKKSKQQLLQSNYISHTLESRQGILQQYSPIPTMTIRQSQQVVIQKANTAYSPKKDKQDENSMKGTLFNSRIPRKLKDLLEEQFVKDSKVREIYQIQNQVI